MMDILKIALVKASDERAERLSFLFSEAVVGTALFTCIHYHRLDLVPELTELANEKLMRDVGQRIFNILIQDEDLNEVLFEKVHLVKDFVENEILNNHRTQRP